jgi:cysteine desulfurase / selenocysteine lyase
MREDRLTIGNVRSHIVGIGSQVPLLDGRECSYINLDNAASTPAFDRVARRVSDFLPWYASVHRGTGFKSQLSTHAYERAHERVLRFLGADPSEHVVIFGKNTTEAVNKLARRFPLQPGDVVLCSLMEHHSNDLPWRGQAEVQRVGVTPEGALDEERLEHLLRRFAGRVRLLAVSGASNVTGYINPIYRLAQKAHEVGALILVDAAQLAAHRKIEMGRLDDPAHIDFMVLSAHKMYAPYGTGALVGRRDLFQQGAPDMVGGGTVSLVTTQDVVWGPLPDKEEAGSPNVLGAVALDEALGCLEEIGLDAIAAHEAELTVHTLERLRDVPGITIYGDCDSVHCPTRVGVVSFTLANMDDHKVAAILSHEAGVGVRNGCFCAMPYLWNLLRLSTAEILRLQQLAATGDHRGVPGLVRISLGCYNTREEIDIAAGALAKIARDQYQGRYVQGMDGHYHPEGYHVDWGRYLPRY